MALCQYAQSMEKESRAQTTRDSDKYIVRMPNGMRDRIAANAKKNNRTMNAEVVSRLEDSYEVTDQLALMAATHAYDQSVNTSLMREKADLQAQLAKKDAEIEILKQRLFLGTMDVPESNSELVELKHAFEAQRTERELLVETGRHLQKIISSQEVNLMVLSTYLVDVINSLPQKLRNEDRIKAAAQFVLGLGDGEKLPAQQGMLHLDNPLTAESVKAVVRGKTVDTGIVARSKRVPEQKSPKPSAK